MKAIIVEDELNVREGFIKMISTFCPEVELVGIADSVLNATSLIQSLNFDVLFLDINLPDGSGFDLLNSLENIDFKVIFVTAYDQYAIPAFKLSAVDYLLKPVSPDLLQNAVNKVKTSLLQSEQSSLKNLKTNLSKGIDQENKIVLKDADNIYLIELNQIIYCTADGSYTNFILKDQKKIVTSTNLKEYEGMLEIYNFIRCHHSYLVNLNHVVALRKQDGGFIETTDGALLPISSRKKAIIMEKIKNTFIN